MQTAIAVPIEHVLVLAAALFLIGLTGVLVRRNVIFLLMSLEIMRRKITLPQVLRSLRRYWSSLEPPLPTRSSI